MFIKLASTLFGTSNDRLLKKLSAPIQRINDLEDEYAKLSDDALKGKSISFRKRLEAGETHDQLLPEAFATVREAAKRALGQRHHDVQLLGGIALHKGMIAEMRTGEGKTLVSTLAAYLNGISGKGVHVVTVNDYLAKRDAEWMGKVYNQLGLEVGCITNDMADHDRQAAYAADITYGTNNEFGFDYLRDNMKFRPEAMAQRGFNFAIVDEVDSILIDEARTPLIISGAAEQSSQLYLAANTIIPSLDDADFEKDEKTRNISLTDIGTEHAEELMQQAGILTEGGLYDAQNITLVHHLNQALRAHKVFERDKDYIVKDNRVVIIDEFTGRMMEGRRFSEGLHQALEAKEGVEIQQENQTLASVTFQNYFRLYPKLSGMTGTAMTEAAEFEEIYNLQCVNIPTNVDVSRVDHNDRIYATYDEKMQAIAVLIKEAVARNQPVLVGTTSIEKSEYLSNALKAENIKHQVLNARYHEQEAQIIGQAGRPGAVTIATNMAGRGTDIQMGGNLEMMLDDEKLSESDINKIKDRVKAEKQQAIEAGGLYVIGTERHESRRIDNQLRGRSGRQGDPGASVFFLSLEDDLMRIFGAERLEPLLANRTIGLKDGEALSHPLISKTLERAQQKVEQQNFEMRKNLLKFDNVMNDQRKVIYDQRREIMEGNATGLAGGNRNNNVVEEMAKDMRHTTIEMIVAAYMPPNSYAEQWDTQALEAECTAILNLTLPITDWAAEEGIADEEILERILDASDKMMAEKAANAGPEVMRRVEKALILQMLDQSWKEHLLALDHLRQGINLRAFGQRDPLNEYKAEAFELFSQMLDSLRETVTRTLSFVEIDPELQAINLMPKANLENTTKTHAEAADAIPPAPQDSSGEKPKQSVESRPQKKIEFDADNPDTWVHTPRNSACPCGSGKKYKHCHGKIAAAG